MSALQRCGRCGTSFAIGQFHACPVPAETEAIHDRDARAAMAALIATAEFDFSVDDFQAVASMAHDYAKAMQAKRERREAGDEK